MKVLLVGPARLTLEEQKYATFPNGLLSMAAVLEKHGHEVKIYDGNIDVKQPADFVDFAPGIIGFTVASGPKITDAIVLSQEFKQLIPAASLIWGGTHPSVLPEQTLIEPYIDFIAIGAGEYTLLELVEHLETGATRLEDIKGLVFKQDGKIIRNEPRPFIEDLDELPNPAWHLVDVSKYWATSLNTSRGCPFKCTYCYNTGFHHGYRADLSVSRVISQIQHLQQNYKVKNIRFFEDNFTFNRKRLREFCNEVIRLKMKFEWDCEARADLSDEEIALMAKAGCVSVGLGVESGSTRMLKFLKKGMDLNQMEKSFWYFVKHKIAPRLYIMHALPTETMDDFVATHEMMARLDFPPYLYMHFVPYPGAALSNYCFETGLAQMPVRLGDWGDFITKAGIDMNLSDLPDEILAEVRNNFGRTYANRRLRFAVKHRPGFLLNGVIHPAEFFKTLRELFRASLAYVVTNKKGQKPAPINILKSDVVIWYQKYQPAVDAQVAKKTAELTRKIDMLNNQLELLCCPQSQDSSDIPDEQGDKVEVPESSN